VALSAETKSGFGKSLRVVVFDESGQVRGEADPYIDMLRSSQGSFNDPVFYTISTQAPSDADWLSITIDDAIRSADPSTVVHLYTIDPEVDLLDESMWKFANPGLGDFRSEADLREQLERAERLPAQEAGARNLLLNQRVAQTSLWLAPKPWKLCGGSPDLSVFQYARTVAVGFDFSARQDLTAAVLSAADAEGVVHVLPFVYTPQRGLEERSRRDRTEYDVWVRQGRLIAVPGSSIDYEDVFKHLDIKLRELGILVSIACYDRWRVDIAKAAAERVGFPSMEWEEVGQGFASMAPRLDSVQDLILEGKIRHGNHPLLTMSAANAIVEMDPAGNRKLAKNKSTSRIDPLVAMVMSVHAVSEGVQKVVNSMYNDLQREVIM
jgi:phage terminase large subunit-like protein